MVHSANKQSLFNLNHLPEARQYFIAFSGGMDSTALLHALIESEIKSKIVAIHINHNINPLSTMWAEHCEAFCEQHQIKYITESVQVKSSSENDCRVARQHVFNRHLSSDDCLLTGHHQSDQIETILFRLIRGTGIHGIIGMLKRSNQFKYSVYRPMLLTPKKCIQDYIAIHQLPYVNDPSNEDNSYRRNFIRNNLLPILNQYEADSFKQIELTSDNLKQSLKLLSNLIGHGNPINIKPYKSSSQLASLLYHWLHNLKLTPPGQKKLIQFSSDCIQAKHDKQPELIFEGYTLKCWNNHIYALLIHYQHPRSSLSLSLNVNCPVNLPNSGGQILISSNTKFNLNIEIEYNKGYEKIQLVGHSQRHQIKKLFQSHNIPPWERRVIPYLYIDNQLMAVGSLFISEKFYTLLDQLNAEYEWQSPQYLL